MQLSVLILIKSNSVRRKHSEFDTNGICNNMQRTILATAVQRVLQLTQVNYVQYHPPPPKKKTQ